jgi:hypothetical protein
MAKVWMSDYDLWLLTGPGGPLDDDYPENEEEYDPDEEERKKAEYKDFMGGD